MGIEGISPKRHTSKATAEHKKYPYWTAQKVSEVTAEDSQMPGTRKDPAARPSSAPEELLSSSSFPQSIHHVGSVFLRCLAVFANHH